ncbi:MAG: hypothetical protein D3907_09710, partial [Candidatus Electrothrix sp. AUS3]|nr:hypothetical protein [Candidatus Electrothrix gigas]
MAIKIGLITTLGTNIGDDFIRLGIQRIIRSLWPDQHLRWVCINKHQPQTIWPYWHPVRHIPEWAPNYHKVALKLPAHRFVGSDLIVQCGAPVLWKNCHQCEWNIPLWDEVIGTIHREVPVLNLAAGSAFDMTTQPTRIDIPDDRDFLTKILDFCRLTTARDPLARILCGELGSETPLIPCTAGLAFEP